MKNILLVFVFCITTSVAFAQVVDNEISKDRIYFINNVTFFYFIAYNNMNTLKAKEIK